MRSSYRGRIGASVVFALIAVLVTGGMTWATFTTLRLEEQKVAEERERRISRALWQMESYMNGVLYFETNREWDEYNAVQTRAPFKVWTERGAEVDADHVSILSPLATSDPPHDWIDLYFQIDPDGMITSPQIDEVVMVWAVENGRVFSPAVQRARSTWDWLSRVLPTIDLRAAVARGMKGNRGRYAARASSTGVASKVQAEARAGSATSTQRVIPVSQAAELDPADAGVVDVSHEYRVRKRSLRDSQRGYLPPAACVEAGVAEFGRDQREIPVANRWNDPEVRSVGDVQFTADPITTFWLPSDGDGAERLAFVRECHMEDDRTHEVFYQGFVGNWQRLKPELLAIVGQLFPTADLAPVDDEELVTAEETKVQMTNLPIRLEVPSIPGGARVAAWHRTRSTLITTWAAALALLVVAGLGVMNLVALTERRMQFAYAVTHELRTPLTTFRLYSDMLSAGLVRDDSKQTYLDTLNTESQRLSTLVEDVLEYARLENNKVRLSNTEVDGASLLDVIGETLKQRCLRNDVEARSENALANGRRVRTDVDLVHRIAGVLIDNACRHARGRNGAAVLVRLCDDNRHVHVDIIDSGPGVDRRDARTIFKPFRRGRGADAAAQGGVGLGLALARNWANLIGGKMTLVARHHPRYGGAHFRLSIPTDELS